MKKRICTLITLMVLFLLSTPLLTIAQQNSSESDQVMVEKKVTDAEGNVNIEIKNLDKGESLKAYLKALSLDNMDGKDVELNVLDSSSEDEILHMKKASDGDETIFLFRSAGDNVDLSEMRDELRSLRITMGKDHKAQQHAWKKDFRTKESKKALLGIYPETSDNGVLVTSVVSGGGAEAAGILKGDVITALDGQVVKSVSQLSAVIGQHEAGYAMKVDFLRNGAPMQVTSTLKAKKSNYSYNYNYDYKYNYDYNYDYKDRERDPCKVFIGVYTTRTGNGMKISKVIEGTSAENASLQSGDIITALNGVEVRSHNELVFERDKNKPGDYYTLNLINNGVPTQIEAQFLECPTDQEEIIEEVPEIIETPEIENFDNNLRLIDFNAYPNPTYGPVNVQFKGEAVPTTVRILDASGKVVFQDVINNFGGQYNKDLNLEKAAPGTLIVNIIQGDQVFSKPLVLLPRA